VPTKKRKEQRFANIFPSDSPHGVQDIRRLGTGGGLDIKGDNTVGQIMHPFGKKAGPQEISVVPAVDDAEVTVRGVGDIRIAGRGAAVFGEIMNLQEEGGTGLL